MSALLDRIVSDPAVADVDLENFELLFDLDETLFRRNRAKDGEYMSDQKLTGSWRPDMPEILDALEQRGMKVGIFSSSPQEYIEGTLLIYARQFGKPATSLASNIQSTLDYAAGGNKYDATDELIAQRRAANPNAQITVVDDAILSFENGVGYVYVPPPLQYKGGEPEFTVVLHAATPPGADQDLTG